MQFMLLMIPKGYETAPPGIDLDPARVETMMKFNADLQKAGILLALNGLHPPSSGARISFKSGQPTVTNGPFAGTSDVLGGYWIINVGSRDEAIAWAKRCPAADNEVIEVRQIQEMEDYSEPVQDIVRQYPELDM
ncbi:YciI family protein [Aquamicrobium zhengzhouense]|uniref:YciI family protein n=1 Tax=Aquamicrobium zhengzhouense TaxID=2781738 RepID=A0ABS0SH82_9HYPH|nr:YciI family protein [Aquamicrobium zhengzhouense]MBI1622662.1 YciI family protein [Aquamicrobium zhengzhouense]